MPGALVAPAVGFAMGMERLVLLLQEQNRHVATNAPGIDVYVVAVGDEAYRMALAAVFWSCHTGYGCRAHSRRQP